MFNLLLDDKDLALESPAHKGEMINRLCIVPVSRLPMTVAFYGSCLVFYRLVADEFF